MEKFKLITPVLIAGGYCKKNVPSLRQIKTYLKKEKNVSKQSLDQITSENVLQKWNFYN